MTKKLDTKGPSAIRVCGKSAYSPASSRNASPNDDSRRAAKAEKLLTTLRS